MDDYEIKRTIWESKVPIEFSIDSDVATNSQSHSLFVMLPRISYFPFYLTKAKLSTVIKGLDDNLAANVWLQFNEKPLKWHYPIGVLYDLYFDNNDNEFLPWLIIVKLKDFPSELIRCSSKDTLKNCFFQTIKEADYIKHRSNIMNNMTADECSKLFDALANYKFDDFWSINKKFMINNENEKLHFLPIRFYDVSFSFRQELIPLKKIVDLTKTNDEVDFLLIDALIIAFPENKNEILTENNNFVAISHGIEIPLITPVLWLANNLCYPDNFVHIVWRNKSI